MREPDGANWPTLPVIAVRDVADGFVPEREALERAGFESPDRARGAEVARGDVLLTSRGSLLKFGLVGLEAEGAIASGNLLVVRAGPEIMPAVLFAILASDVYRPLLDMRGAAGLLSLSARDLSRLTIALPPIEEQRRIAGLLQQAEDAYRAGVDAAAQRRALARTLINERLSGRLRT